MSIHQITKGVDTDDNLSAIKQLEVDTRESKKERAYVVSKTDRE